MSRHFKVLLGTLGVILGTFRYCEVRIVMLKYFEVLLFPSISIIWKFDCLAIASTELCELVC